MHRPLSLIRIIVEVIDRTRSTPAVYRVVECYYFGTREAQAQPRLERDGSRRKFEEGKRGLPWEEARGQRKCIATAAARRTRLERFLVHIEYAPSWEMLWETSYKRGSFVEL